MNPTAQKPSAATLALLFEPIRDDLRQVEREFARHIQSQVALIPTIGNYIQDSGGLQTASDSTDRQGSWVDQARVRLWSHSIALGIWPDGCLTRTLAYC